MVQQLGKDMDISVGKGERINIRHNTIIKEKKYGT